ncbi:uncharacterized protein LOC105841556 [Bombyx mori]|uniref:Secreted protein n=1 Tax=Bombyx mori TaxID=7091 RepID=A0A8R2R1N3_BOMMO|nr:uncharacterized protein LOC105841556 [Bombyx mori]
MSVFCVICLVILLLACGHNAIHRRQKRYLLFTKDTQWGVFVTLSIPLHPETTVSVAWFFEANYYNVDNSTYFEPLLGDINIARSRNERNADLMSDFTRRRLYFLIERVLEQHDYSGRACLLRVICENGTSNLLHSGVLGDILHLILTPSTSMAEDNLPDCYYEAEYYGLDDRCEKYTESCPSSPLEVITTFIDRLI